MLIYEVVGLESRRCGSHIDASDLPDFGKKDGSVEVKMGSFWKNEIDGFGGQYAFIHFPSLQVGGGFSHILLSPWNLGKISSGFHRFHHLKGPSTTFLSLKKVGWEAVTVMKAALFYERKFSCCFSRKILQPPFFLVGGVFARKH